jgi:hypothetical protein
MSERARDRAPETIERDAGDVGVPMLPGSPDEPVGPEDALGEGPTRGDYRDRIGPSSYHPHQGTTPQRPNAEDIGDAPGKGGVDTVST